MGPIKIVRSTNANAAAERVADQASKAYGTDGERRSEILKLAVQKQWERRHGRYDRFIYSHTERRFHSSLHHNHCLKYQLTNTETEKVN